MEASAVHLALVAVAVRRLRRLACAALAGGGRCCCASCCRVGAVLELRAPVGSQTGRQGRQRWRRGGWCWEKEQRNADKCLFNTACGHKTLRLKQLAPKLPALQSGDCIAPSLLPYIHPALQRALLSLLCPHTTHTPPHLLARKRCSCFAAYSMSARTSGSMVSMNPSSCRKVSPN